MPTKPTLCRKCKRHASYRVDVGPTPILTHAHGSSRIWREYEWCKLHADEEIARLRAEKSDADRWHEHYVIGARDRVITYLSQAASHIRLAMCVAEDLMTAKHNGIPDTWFSGWARTLIADEMGQDFQDKLKRCTDELRAGIMANLPPPPPARADQNQKAM